MKKMGRILGLYLLFVPEVLIGNQQAVIEPEQVVSWNFDWDDNVIHMPTTVVLLPKGRGNEIMVKPSQMGAIGPQLGKPGPYENYEFNPEKGSLRNFYDLKKNNFLADIRTAEKRQNWKAPAWEKFQQALSAEETVGWVTIITGRGHATERVLAGLEFLRNKGHIPTIPKAEHIFNVGRLAPFADRAKAKAEVIVGLLEKVSNVPLPKEAKQLPTVLHVWCYSDDEFKSLQAIYDVLLAYIQKGRWANVKVVLWISGPVPDKDLPLIKAFQAQAPKYAPGFAVLTADGPRPLLAAELTEISK